MNMQEMRKAEEAIERASYLLSSFKEFQADDMEYIESVRRSLNESRHAILNDMKGE